MANTSINLINLDQGLLKESFKDYLRTQDVFKDYVDDDSNFGVLLDILAYNTWLNGFFLNMVASEAFLDSAQLRSSIVSRAKELNYTPRSSRSARAKVNLVVEQSDSGVLIIPKGTTFSSVVGTKTFTFSTNETKTYFTALNQTSNTYIFTTDDIDIYEGVYVRDSFIMNYTDEDQRFVLSNKGIDTSSLVVNILEDNGSTVIPYTLATSLLGLKAESKRYFLQAANQTSENEDFYEIVFGNDIIGRKPKNGATIVIDYRVTNKTAPNGANRFIIDKDITGDNSGRITVTTVASAIDGADAETLKSIQFNAPRHFQTQERAVTASDYEQVLMKQFPEINAISVYGGEEVNPPKYGRVFIAIDISDIDGLPDSKKQEYYTFLRPRISLPVEPVFVEPTYLYWRPKTYIQYNINETSITPREVETLIMNTLVNYNDTYLDNFKKVLRYSKLVKLIDDSHSSIVSNQTDIEVYKKITPVVKSNQNIIISLGIKLKKNVPYNTDNHPDTDENTIYSSSFNYRGDKAILEDDGRGVIRIVKSVGGNHVKIKDVGTVDYDTGVIRLNNFYVDGYTDGFIKVFAVPVSKDIEPAKSDIFTLEVDSVQLTIKPVRV